MVKSFGHHVVICVTMGYDLFGPVAELADAADLKSVSPHFNTSVYRAVVAPYVLMRAAR